MDKFGIIGKPLGHSFSKKYFTEKFESNKIDAQFLNFELANIDEFKKTLTNNSDLKGICVTIPYKQEVIDLLDQIDPLAKEIGAVNSIRIDHSDKGVSIKGFNTDIIGFSESLADFIDLKIENALILGTGGASKAIALGLKKMGINYKFVSRQSKEGQFTYSDLNQEIISQYKLIVNCSPVGTFPNSEECPNIPYEHLGSEHYLYDLVYNPQQTLFMKKAELKGANTHNGLKMLHLQAEASWKIWNE